MPTPADIPTMRLTDVDGAELEIHDRGSGEPVVFIHTSRDEWYAVLGEPALAERYRLVHYHRRGYGDSTSHGVPLSIAEHAADCRAVMSHLDIDRAHVVALSGAGTIQLQLALDFPDAVHSLALLEPLLPTVTERFDEQSSEWTDVLAVAMPLLEEGRRAEALDTLFRYLGGSDYREEADQHLPPGWFERIIADWDSGFQHDFVAMNSWPFDAEDAARITAPVLNVKASRSTNLHHAYHEAIRTWIPHAENVVLPDTGHFMPQTNPKATAELLADFFSRHPLDPWHHGATAAPQRGGAEVATSTTAEGGST